MCPMCQIKKTEDREHIVQFSVKKRLCLWGHLSICLLAGLHKNLLGQTHFHQSFALNYNCATNSEKNANKVVQLVLFCRRQHWIQMINSFYH